MTFLFVILACLPIRAEDVCSTAEPRGTPATCADLFFNRAPLPDPAAVIVDPVRERVLFSIAPFNHHLPPADAATTAMPILQKWQTTIAHANDLARTEAPAANSWVDVTEAWPANAKLFAAYRRHLAIGIANEDCYDFAARWNDVEPIAGGARELHYMEIGFVETTAAEGEVGFVTVRARSGPPVTTHAFVPIPGTQWVVHKQGTAPIAALITPLTEVLEQYGTLNRNHTTVRYFRRAKLGESTR